MNKLLFAVLLTLSSSVHALFLTDYFVDTDTGLDWLHGRHTLGLSYLEASNEFNNHGGGWRYATGEQVDSLFSRVFDGFRDNTGFGTSSSRLPGADPDQLADVLGFEALFGATACVGGGFCTYGLYSRNPDVRNLWWNEPVSLTGAFRRGTDTEVYSPARPGRYDTNYTLPINFTFAVREHCSEPCQRADYVRPVPEPGLLGLLAFGLLTLGAAAKMRA